MHERGPPLESHQEAPEGKIQGNDREGPNNGPSTCAGGGCVGCVCWGAFGGGGGAAKPRAEKTLED